jgi:hypothetical protein
MADFALWATACETAFWPAGTFMAAYAGNRDEAIGMAIEGDLVTAAIRTLMTERTEPWVGASSELLAPHQRHHRHQPAKSMGSMCRSARQSQRALRIDRQRESAVTAPRKQPSPRLARLSHWICTTVPVVTLVTVFSPDKFGGSERDGSGEGDGASRDSARVSLMITMAQKARSRGLGYSDDSVFLARERDGDLGAPHLERT